MINDDFFSHYPFFTPTPNSAQEALDSMEDVPARVRRTLHAMNLPKIEFTVDRSTASAWYDPETKTMSFGIASPTDPVQR